MITTSRILDTAQTSRDIGIIMRRFLQDHSPESLNDPEILVCLDKIDKNRFPSHSWANFAAIFQHIELESNGKVSAYTIIKLCRQKALCQI